MLVDRLFAGGDAGLVQFVSQLAGPFEQLVDVELGGFLQQSGRGGGEHFQGDTGGSRRGACRVAGRLAQPGADGSGGLRGEGSGVDGGADGGQPGFVDGIGSVLGCRVLSSSALVMASRIMVPTVTRVVA